MKRAIVQPAALSGAALNELKQWLGIASSAEDDALVSLLHVGLGTCEAFIGQMPIETECREIFRPDTGWQNISSRPIKAITNVEQVMDDGTFAPLDAGQYEVEIDHHGIGKFRCISSRQERAVAVRYIVGLAESWATLPDGLRHGIVRIAAHHYRDRDAEKPLQPPASVAALWKPWRQVRLA